MKRIYYIVACLLSLMTILPAQAQGVVGPCARSE